MSVRIGPFRLSEKTRVGFYASLLFNLLFLAAGAGVVGYAFWQYQAGVALGPNLYIMAGVGVVFLIMGVLSLRSTLRSRKQARKLAALKEKHADEPWMVRPAWRSAELDESTGGGRGLAVMAAFWNLISWPLAGVFMYNELLVSSEPEWGVLFVLIFPLVGIGLAWGAAVKYLRRRKYGTSTCTMETMPGRLGRYLKARVKTGMNAAEAPDDGLHVQLSCYRRYVRYTTDSDGDRKKEVRKDLKWRDEKHMRGRTYGAENKLELPISFKLPTDRPPSTPEKSEERIMWTLDVSADVPGLDYESSFEVPIFEPEEGALPPDEAAGDGVQSDPHEAEDESIFWDLGDETAQQLTREEPAPEAQKPAADPYGDYEVGGTFAAPVTEGITMSRTPGGGLRFAFDAKRNRKNALILGVFGVAMIAIGAALFSGSLLVGALFLGFGALAAYGAVYTWTKSSSVTVENGQVRVETTGIGATSTEAFRCEQLISVRVEIPSKGNTYTLNIYRADPSDKDKLRQGTEKLDQFSDFIEQTGVMGEKPAGADDPFQHIKDAIKKHGQVIQVADNLPNKQEADWMAEKIQRAAKREAQFS